MLTNCTKCGAGVARDDHGYLYNPHTANFHQCSDIPPPDPTREVDGARAAVLRAALEHIADGTCTFDAGDPMDAAEYADRALAATDAGREWLEAWRAARNALDEAVDAAMCSHAPEYNCEDCDSAKRAIAQMDRLTGPGRDGAPKLKP